MIAAQTKSDWTCSLVAWGMPSDPLTFSGYSKSLADTMRKRGLLRGEYSMKQFRAADLFSGAYGLKFKGFRPRLTAKRSWVWSDQASRLLEKRVAQEIQRSGDRGSFLQLGTIVEIDPKYGEYACLADMTIPQAHRAGQFFFGEMSKSQIDGAIEVQRRVLKNASHAFTLTEWARQSMIDDFDVAPNKVSVVYMGSTLAVPADPTVTKKSRQILYVGIDWKRKGGPQLIEGFRMLRERMPDAELVVVGCSPEVNCPGVRIEGYLNPRDPEARKRVTKLYQESTCFTLMSDFEPLGNVMIEAYGMGLPVVAFDSGSRSEIVRDGQTGYLCRDREPKSIADAFYRLLSDPAACAKMGQNARQRVEDDFNWDVVVSKIVDQMAPSSRPITGAVRSEFASAKEVVQ